MILFMAIAAIDTLVCPLKFIACQGVVELVLIKADHFEITAMVIIMAGCTFFSFNLGRYMITSV